MIYTKKQLRTIYSLIRVIKDNIPFVPRYLAIDCDGEVKLFPIQPYSYHPVTGQLYWGPSRKSFVIGSIKMLGITKFDAKDSLLEL